MGLLQTPVFGQLCRSLVIKDGTCGVQDTIIIQQHQRVRCQAVWDVPIARSVKTASASPLLDFSKLDISGNLRIVLSDTSETTFS